MPEESHNDRDWEFISIKEVFAKLREILSDSSLTDEEKKKSLEEVLFMYVKNKKVDGYEKFKNVLLSLQFLRYKAEDYKKIIVRLSSASNYIDELSQELEELMVKEQKEFFYRYPELLPMQEGVNVYDIDIDPRWRKFRDYYMKKLNDGLKTNIKYEDWKRIAMVQYAKQKFHEFYSKTGNLKEKEEEAKKFYYKFPKKFKKFLKILSKR